MKIDNVRTRFTFDLARSFAILFAVSMAWPSQSALAQRTKPAASPSGKTVQLQTEPNATVWVDDVKRGVTNATGHIELTKISLKAHVLRVRATGFKEVSRNIAPPIPAQLEIKLTTKADSAELAFQEAETKVLTARDDPSRQVVVDLYEKAIAARPVYPAAHLGLARVLADMADNEGALAEIEEARRDRPNYAEASAVEGRIKRSMNDETGAAASFRRAIREGKGYQPEAHTGLALVFEDQGQNEEAVKELEIAITQLADSEPMLYQMLGSTYERMEKYKEAVAAYEKYLALAPSGSLAPAIRSTIDQLRRQANGEVLLP